MTETVNIIDSVDDVWIKGSTYTVGGEFLNHWIRLTDKAHSKMFWFLQPPIDYLKRYGVEIDQKTSDALEFLFEDKWVDFCYLLHAVDDKNELIKIFLGPIAAIAKETGCAPLSVLKTADILSLVRGQGTTFGQKKAIIADLVAGLSFDEALTKNSFEDKSSEIASALDGLISENSDQWEKAKDNPKLGNWFVGQIMKKFGGKIDPVVVKDYVMGKLK